MRNIRFHHFLLIVLLIVAQPALSEEKADKEIWEVDPDFARLRPTAIAVAPMDNFSLEPGIEEALHNEVYQNLSAKGYARISADHVRSVMSKLGISIPALMAGISPQRLGRELKADAILMGQIEQSASIHSGLYDAVVVSTSLRLVDAKSGRIIWRTEQWRTAHRQWQIDPINLLLNLFAHAHASREGRIAYLVREMLKTLPQGPVVLQADDLFNQAEDISVVP